MTDQFELRHFPNSRLTVAYMTNGTDVVCAFAQSAKTEQWSRKLGRTIAVNRLKCEKPGIKWRHTFTCDLPRCTAETQHLWDKKLYDIFVRSRLTGQPGSASNSILTQRASNLSLPAAQS